MKTHYRVVIIGDEMLAAEAGQRLIDRGHQLVALITESAQIAGWGDERGIPRRSIAEVIEGEDFDLLFSLANLRPLPRALLEKAKVEAINFHDGPLPRYAGVYTTSWAILEGAREYGVRFHRMVEALDAGDIVAKRDFLLDDEETALSLNTRAFVEALGAFDELIERIEARGDDGAALSLEEGRLPSRVYLKRDRPRAVGVIDPSMGVEALSRLVRALDFGAYPNPLTKPKIRVGGAFYIFDSIELLDKRGRDAPGLLSDIAEGSAALALSDAVVRLNGLRALSKKAALKRGAKIEALSRDERRAIERAHRHSARFEEHFIRELEALNPPSLHLIRSRPTHQKIQKACVDVPLMSTGSAHELIAAFALTISRYAHDAKLSFAFESESQRELHAETSGLLMRSIPITLELAPEQKVSALLGSIETLLGSAPMSASIPEDLFMRRAELIRPELPIGITLGEPAPGGPPLQLFIRGSVAALRYDPEAIDRDDLLTLSETIDTVLSGMRARPEAALGSIPLLSSEARARLAEGIVGESVPLGEETLSDLFEAAVDRAKTQPALIFGGATYSYAELEGLADAVASELIERRLPRNSIIGLAAARGPALVYGALGIMKAGHAYLPLDPDYPRERLMMMLEDSASPLLLVDGAGERLFQDIPLERTRIDQLSPVDHRVRAERRANDLGYVIFTSGSTGRPKGVMVEQRNIVNFLAGMDDRVERGEDAGAFLGLTSLSFDISVLELFYCLTRGMTLVLASDEEKTLRHDASKKELEIGLFYWGNYDGEADERYELLLEGAKIADKHGLNSVFIPERHFHEFGGAYPNPSVAAAALSTITKQIQIRAGSCVLPLHHPLRVAEEWAMVDRLSGGRVGLAFASGWQPEDFILRPENAPPKNKEALFRDLDIVRRLFRGERVEFASGDGKSLAIRTMPRPIQKEIPIWVTTAGNIETFAMAGAAGANLLTHLLGQSIEEVGEKIARYREALREHGHDPSKFRVTLMLHTFVGNDREEARRVVEGPLKSYLRSAAGLIKNYAWAFPAFKRPAGLDEASDIDLSTLSEDELEAILDFAFQRYFEESGLFGSVEDCAAQLDRVRAIGVDEVSCLVDFGIPSKLALESVERLGVVLENERASAQSEGLAAQIQKHGVRSLQGTPSTLRMLLMNEESREALRDVRYFYIGGEPLPGALVRELEELTEGRARIENMYGPTETTVWSSTGRASAHDEIGPLGAPIANTRLLVLDETLEPIPPGMIGELYIGGAGVTRGYIGRDDLTRAVFLDDPHRPGERIYRTGDRAKLRRDGTIDFIGRVDHQVKVRGFRIELGEIERRAAELPGVEEAVAIVREDRAGDPQIALYLEGSSFTLASEAREALSRCLPAYMVPNHIVKIDRWPLTPNEKIDRKALPAPHEIVMHEREVVAPENELERAIVELYASLFGRPEVSAMDHFFELGGHSLLAVEAHRRLKEKLEVPVTVIDIFRFPIIRDLARHLGAGDEVDASLEKTRARALARRRSMQQRRVPSSA